MTDISGIRSKLIGISFLPEAENALVKLMWAESFSPKDALWVEAPTFESGNTIVDDICDGIREHDMNIMNGSCAVALFLDQSALQDEFVQSEIIGISEKIQSILFCTIQLELQFVYIGTNPKPVASAKEIKNALLLLSQKNVEFNQQLKRICLVARNVIMRESDKEPWIPVMVYLDLLRRTDVNNVMPAEGADGNDDVCFIRFAEHDRPGYQKLEENITKYGEQLGSSGFTELRTALSGNLKEIEEAARNTFPVDENRVPPDPDMTVNGTWKRRLAKKGKNDAFFIAQRNTLNTLIAVGNEMKEDIEAFFLRYLENDGLSYFWKEAEKAGAGLNLIANSSKMKELFSSEAEDASEPQPPSLAYNEDGYKVEIAAYLSQMREYAIKSGRKSFLKALQDTYDTINQSCFEEKRKEIQKKLAIDSNELRDMPDETAFMNSVAGDGSFLKKVFFPIQPGGMTKRLVVDSTAEEARFHDQIVGQKAMVLLLPGPQPSYLDEAKPKGLHMLSFNCDKARLDDLIREG